MFTVNSEMSEVDILIYKKVNEDSNVDIFLTSLICAKQVARDCWATIYWLQIFLSSDSTTRLLLDSVGTPILRNTSL